MEGDWNYYINGFIERLQGGKYEGKISVDGIDLSPIEGVYFTQDDKKYLWIKRKAIMQYDWDTGEYLTRKRTPYFECYLEKQINNGGIVSYKGEFVFLKFRYKIEGIWDNILGKDKKRLNLYVERLKLSEQTILKNINERKKNGL